jgi:DNA-binding transcriptional regulator YdaS (Cro superfamily)
MQLLGCPPGFIEHAVLPEDLHDRLKIRTFAVAAQCVSCETTAADLIDVAENLEQLVLGTVPAGRCPTCQRATFATVTPELVKRLRSLPARDRDQALDKFLTKARALPADKLENVLVVGAQKPAAATAGTTRRAMYVAAGLSLLVIAGLVVVAAGLWTQRGNKAVADVGQGSGQGAITPPPPTFSRPDWIISDVPASAQCHDLINRLTCVGVSSYRPSRDEGLAEANEAALEELVNSIGLKISDAFFRERILPAYSEVRTKALSALQAAELDRSSPAYAAANDALRKARTRVVELLRISGGAAVPSQRSDWYWEEYAGENGKANEVLVFVRYDVGLDATRSLVEKYSAATTAMGATAVTAFPALAWQYPDFTGGVTLTKPGKRLGGAGLGVQDLIVAVDGKPVSDATGFARLLEETARAADAFAVTVKKGKAPAQVVEVRK